MSATVATTSSSSAMQHEYLPIEFLLLDMQDFRLTSWISDEVGCLRAVFKIYVCEDRTKKDILYVGDARIELVRTDFTEFEISSADAINSTSHENQAKCLHLKDGTAVIFLCQGGGNLIGYHFCFEDAPDDTFQTMINDR